MQTAKKIAQEQISPTERCAACLRNAIEEKPVSFLSKRGTIALHVFDDRSLTIRFGDKKKPIELDCADENADFRIDCSRAVFAQIVDGTIDAVAAIENGSLKLTGKMELLEELVILMERGKSMLSLRAGR